VVPFLYCEQLLW